MSSSAIRLPDYETYSRIFAGRPMPFAYVNLDLLDANLRQLSSRAGRKGIRIASKSVRSLALLRYIRDALEAEARYAGIMCLTAPEAVWLSQEGFDDLLVGYPTWHPAHVRAVVQRVAAGSTISLMIDSVQHVRHLEAIAADEGVTLPVCLDVDMSVDYGKLHFGVWRSGITSADDALRVFSAIKESPHLRLEGVMGYEAQIAGLGDSTPGQAARNTAIWLLKRRSIKPISTRRAVVVTALETAGADLRFVNGGGTGSLNTTAREAIVTEVTVGSGFYAPGLFDHYRDFKLHPAAGFAVEVVRAPTGGTFTCLGGGYIASGGTSADKQPTVHLPAGAQLTEAEGAGEAQTPVRYDGPLTLRLGDPIFMRHAKAGELCERFNTLLLVRGDVIRDEVPTYRGEGHAFL
ncbi:MAG: amino acid deaminase/aldolase [Chloroflexota bacterium]